MIAAFSFDARFNNEPISKDEINEALMCFNRVFGKTGWNESLNESWRMQLMKSDLFENACISRLNMDQLIGSFHLSENDSLKSHQVEPNLLSISNVLNANAISAFSASVIELDNTKRHSMTFAKCKKDKKVVDEDEVNDLK